MLQAEFHLALFFSLVRLEEQLDKNQGYRKIIQIIMKFKHISGREEMSYRKTIMACHAEQEGVLW